MDDAPVFGCLLKKKRITNEPMDFCKDNCNTCGWNQRVAAERKREIRSKYGGLTRTEIRCPFCQGRIKL